MTIFFFVTLNSTSNFLFVTLNSIQSRIVGWIARGGIILKPSEFAGDSGSNLDYSGGRKTHRFPPPYGLGSHSLTHRPTENPTGMTHWQELQGILNHAPLFRMTTKQIPCGKLPIPAFPNQGKEHSVGFLLTWEGGLQDTLPNSGRVRVGSNYFFVTPAPEPESHSWTD